MYYDFQRIILSDWWKHRSCGSRLRTVNSAVLLQIASGMFNTAATTTTTYDVNLDEHVTVTISIYIYPKKDCHLSIFRWNNRGNVEDCLAFA